MRHVLGSALDPVGPRPLILAHVVNNQLRLGKGFALALVRRWPAADLPNQPSEPLGWTLFSMLADADILVAHMVAQTLGKHRFPLSMPHLENCIRGVITESRERGWPVHAPRFGCGLARGHWEDISQLIPADWTIYTLPHERDRFPLEHYATGL